MIGLEWQSLTAEDCARKLKTSLKNGLTERQAAQRLRERGPNELKKPGKKNLFLRFLAQFSDFMVVILLIAAGVSFVTSWLRQDGGYIDSIIILFIVTVNAVTGMMQECRAEKAIEALQKMASPMARVVRGGVERTVPASRLVPGDLVRLNAGDLVPADLRVAGAVNLKAEESALTGESLPAFKSAGGVFPQATPLGDRRNLLYSASSVASGHGTGIVVETGMNTQVGRIAHLIGTQSAPETPLQKKLAQTGRWLGTGALAVCLVIFVMGLLQKVEPLEMFLISISLAVAAIPEGLPAVVTITLAVGVRRMAANRAIVRRMPAVETLGSASVICSDKTGTLTQNRMTVVELRDFSGRVPPASKAGAALLSLAALCTNCTVENGKVRGEPTETALVRAAPTGKSRLTGSIPASGRSRLPASAK